MRILLSGPPSCGKSSQGRRLAANLGIPHVSSGDLIRAAAAAGDPRDVALLAEVSDGSLAPSGAICHMVARRLEADDCADGFLLDGFPRKPLEAAFLVEMQRIDALVVLQASESTLLERLRSRVAAGRTDDDPANLPRRMAAFRTETMAAHRELARHDVPVVHVDAEGPPDLTATRIEAALAPFLRRDVRTLRFA